MFRIRDISKVLESIPDDNDAILIGGQALNIWAECYARQDPSLNTYSPFFSHYRIYRIKRRGCKLFASGGYFNIVQKLQRKFSNAAGNY